MNFALMLSEYLNAAPQPTLSQSDITTMLAEAQSLTLEMNKLEQFVQDTAKKFELTR